MTIKTFPHGGKDFSPWGHLARIYTIWMGEWA